MLSPYGDCSEETNLSFRVIYPNGTIKPIDLSRSKSELQPLNFCPIDIPPIPIDPITPYAIETTKDKFILVTYTVAADINNSSTYNDYMMLIDLYGNIRSKTLIGPSYVDQNNIWIPQNFMIPNVNNDRGFLYLSVTRDGEFNLTQWIINDDLSLRNITAETILPSIPDQSQFLPTATVDGGYMIIFTNNSINTSINPFSSQGGIYAIYCEYNKTIEREPVILYQSANPLNISSMECRINYSGVGHVCLILLQPNSITNPNTVNSNSTSFFIKINFLSQGTLFNVTTSISPDLSNLGIMSLRYGGYFYYGTNITEQNTTLIWGYVLDDNGKLYNWNLTYPTEINRYGIRQVLTNNTVVMAQPTINKTWSLITTDLYKIHGGDNPYGNILITSTTPSIGQNNIAAKDIENIKITYAIPIALSDGTITIFQSNDSFGIVRQNVSGSNENYVKLDNNTVTVKVIDSTFNNPGKTYYVRIANNFVVSQLYDEPLYGLNNYVWNFTIAEEGNVNEPSKIQKWLLDSIDGKVRLISDGNGYFENFIRNNKLGEFFNDLTKDLTDALSVASVQITSTERFQFDTTLPKNSPKQYLLSININHASGRADLIANYLDIMIRNKSITTLAYGNSSQYLDQNYGYVTIPKWYNDPSLMFQLILTGIFILILTILCFISIYYDAINEAKSESVTKTFFSIIKCDLHNLIQFLLPINEKKVVDKDEVIDEDEVVDEDKVVDANKRNHFKIYSYGFSILTFILDILFAEIEADSIKNIFFASVFFVTVPYAIKLGYAVYIIFGELVRSKESKEDSEKSRLIPIKDLKDQSKDLENQKKSLESQRESLEDQEESLENQRKSLESQRESLEDQEESLENQRKSLESQKNEEEELKKVIIMKWLMSSRSHKIILIILILLAGADVKALYILDFKFCSYEFGIELSEEFEERIILGEIISVIIKNIPELAIRTSICVIITNDHG
ncbi:hypothetical protein RclHR1_15250003 [Rhizophagus clarus]|uniref:Uncharacterized protein n=1 Tax=Rhizophagus clarus TaxID=94130 RepID=A0A2Z6QS61_9GLOM|nr:hypothetical protein RclHR1_15250003 [Rhizophagus clarus]